MEKKINNNFKEFKNIDNQNYKCININILKDFSDKDWRDILKREMTDKQFLKLIDIRLKINKDKKI